MQPYNPEIRRSQEHLPPAVESRAWTLEQAKIILDNAVEAIRLNAAASTPAQSGQEHAEEIASKAESIMRQQAQTDAVQHGADVASIYRPNPGQTNPNNQPEGSDYAEAA